jgi:outer membrane receptor protein involved in Fe transport
MARSRRLSAEIASVLDRSFYAGSLGASTALLAFAATVGTASESAVLRADIPAQPLAQALDAFRHQTGLALIYVSSVIGSQRSQPVASGLAAGEALGRMLQGTGLRFEYLSPRSVRIFAAGSPTPPGWTAPADAAISEVVVTASRREENLQDLPFTVQALGGEQLKQLSLTTFNDLLQYTANVTYSGNGPGTGNIFVRGLGSVGTGNQSQSTTAPFPNVALYLDEQSMQFPARNNDVYLVDLERVEVLEGPQGTLFGGGAQAGVIRYITRKPRLDVTSAEANAAYGTTAGGADNSRFNAMLNLPLVPGALALRTVIFSERRGGYIDNIPSTLSYKPGSAAAATGVSASNAALVGSDTNPNSYQGVRASLLWKLNPDWDLLLQQNFQDMEADGYFYAYPYDSNGTALQRNQIAAFTPAFTKDRYESTAWTLNGRFRSLSAIYTGSFMVRHIEGQQDYSNYLRNSYTSYYNCIGAKAGYFNDTYLPGTPPKGLEGTKLTCYAPVARWHDTTENQHQSHELRISTSPSSRLRGIFGTFWEKFVIFDQIDFDYMVIPQCDPANLSAALAGGPACLSAVGPFPGAFANDPGLREHTNTAFGTDAQRGYRQLAFFGSLDFDLVPNVLTATVGARHYRYDEFEDGSNFLTAANPLSLNHPNGTCTRASPANDRPNYPSCGHPFDLSESESGWVSRANLAWHITPDVMTYYAFSQGFRPGGYNRTDTSPGQHPIQRAPYCGHAASDPLCMTEPYRSNSYQYLTPVHWGSDSLVNHEMGIKSEFMNHRMVVNASAYRMRWSNVQWTLGDSPTFGTLGFVANGPSYTVKGLELQLAARVAEGLTLQGAAAWNHSEQTSTPCLKSSGITPGTPSNPTPAGQCITVINGRPYTNPWGPLGSSLPYSPPLQFNLRARYEWNVGLFRPFAMLSATHTAAMSTAPENYLSGEDPSNNPPSTAILRYTIPAYTTYDAALGVNHDRWTAQIQGSNLSNVYGPTNISSAQYITAVIPLRPRVVMAQFGYTF